MSFQGSLKELPLPDIIQLVSVSGKTGRFTLTRDNERGAIFLKNGQMVHAMIGDLVGEEAIYALAIWNHGEFQFEPGTEADRQTISKSNTNLLMEAARRLDEWRVLSKKVPSVEYVPELLTRPALRRYAVSQAALPEALKIYWAGFDALSDAERLQRLRAAALLERHSRGEGISERGVNQLPPMLRREVRRLSPGRVSGAAPCPAG